MANRRMLGKNISTSMKLNKVSNFAFLLWTCMQPHSDDWGLLDGEPETIKAIVFPIRKSATIAKISKAIDELVYVRVEDDEQGLLLRYYMNKHPYIQIVDFDDHQTLKKDRKRRLEHPIPENWKPLGIHWNPSESTGFPKEGKGSKEKEEKKEDQDLKERSTPPDGDPVDNFQETCPIKIHDKAYVTEICNQIRGSQKEKLGNKTLDELLKAIDGHCARTRKNWFYTGCTDECRQACERFIDMAIKAMKKQLENPEGEPIKWKPAYLAKILQNQFNEDGELHFRAIAVRTREEP
jgi:hypothetical protein